MFTRWQPLGHIFSDLRVSCARLVVGSHRREHHLSKGQFKYLRSRADMNVIYLKETNKLYKRQLMFMQERNHTSLSTYNTSQFTSDIPSEAIMGWYGILTRQLNDDEIKEKIELFKNHVISDLSRPDLYGRFKVCFFRKMIAFGQINFSLSPECFGVDKTSFKNKSPNIKQLSRVKKMVDFVSSRFNPSRDNLAIISKRLKAERFPADLFLHHQFMVNLNRHDMGRLLEVYFNFQRPRAYHLTSLEFEKFMGLVLRYKVGDTDHLIHTEALIAFFDSLLDDNIPLTKFELTKYVFFVLKNLLNVQKVSNTECFNKIMALQGRITFSQSIWNLLLCQFWEKKDIILQEMSHKVILNSDLIRTICCRCTSKNELINIIEIIKLKHMHLNPELFELIIQRLLFFKEFGYSTILVKAVLESFKRLRQTNNFERGTVIHRTKILRLINSRYEELNSVLLYEARQRVLNELQHSDSQLLYYTFKPSPMLMYHFLDCLSLTSDTQKVAVYSVLKIMNAYKIPLLNSQSLRMLSDLYLHPADSIECMETDMNLVKAIVNLAYNSAHYNQYFHNCVGDSRYDKKYLSGFLHKTINSSAAQETRAIFELAFNIYKQWSLNDQSSTLKDKRAEIKKSMLQIYKELIAISA